jgi:glycosyltransferase involved in cell wall biosynthesis
MIRILHLLDHPSDFESARGADSLGRALGDGFVVTTRTIGFGGDWRNVATAAAMLRRERDAFDVVHAWSGAGLAVAALGARTPIIFSPPPDLRPRQLRWLRAVMAHRRVENVCATSTLRRMLVRRGVPIERCHLIRPGVEFSRVKRRRDPELRASLGFNDADHVFLAAGESTRAAAHEQGSWAIGILNVADARHKLLTWGRGPLTDKVQRLAMNTNPRMLSVAQKQLHRSVEFEELLPAADAVLVTATGPVATLPIAICMAAALPIVSTVTATVAELLEDRHTALMAAQSPRAIARRAMDFMEDPSLQWTLCDMARTEAYEYFAFTRFVNQFRAIYRQAVDGDRVEVPQPGPGAGLRFHGRT